MDTKLAIERRAMVVAKRWCTRRGWTNLTNVSGTRSWDFEARDSTAKTRYVEVKGTTGGPQHAEVTKAEVDWARRHGDDHCIIVVHGIKASASGGKTHASGGEVACYDPWKPSPRELTAQRFTWAPSADRIPER